MKLYLELGKARLTFLVLVTTLTGFLLGSQEPLNWILLCWTMAGTASLALGVHALNQWMEVEQDGKMNRTRNRPLPSGRISRIHALVWGVMMILAGTTVLYSQVNSFTAELGLYVAVLYLLFYTPMKQYSSLNTLVGAICGAIPPMMGWTAATGDLGLGAWLLAAVLFVWQIPHFLALAWMYRDDYAQGGFRMLPATDPQGRMTFKMVVLYTLALFPVGLAFSLIGLSGWIYATGSVVLGAYFLQSGIRLYHDHSESNAKRVFLASIVYLPVLLILMVADRGPVYLTPSDTQAVTFYEETQTFEHEILPAVDSLEPSRTDTIDRGHYAEPTLL